MTADTNNLLRDTDLGSALRSRTSSTEPDMSTGPDPTLERSFEATPRTRLPDHPHLIVYIGIDPRSAPAQ